MHKMREKEKKKSKVGEVEKRREKAVGKHKEREWTAEKGKEREKAAEKGKEREKAAEKGKEREKAAEKGKEREKAAGKEKERGKAAGKGKEREKAAEKGNGREKAVEKGNGKEKAVGKGNGREKAVGKEKGRQKAGGKKKERDKAAGQKTAGFAGKAGKTEKNVRVKEWKTSKKDGKDSGFRKAEKQSDSGRQGKGKQDGKGRQNYGNREGGSLQDPKVKEICHAFGECGGCQLLGIPYKKQLAEKERELEKLLKPYVKLEGMIGMEEPEHYRNKVNAAFTHDRNGKPLSGVYKAGTHYIIPIEECVLEDRRADEIIRSIRQLLPSFKIKIYDEDMDYGLLRHVMVRTGHATGQIMVVLVLASPIMPSKKNFVKELLRRHPEITTIIVNVNDRKTSMVLGDKEQVIYGKGYIEDVLCGITYKISPKSFYQVNSVQAEKLYEKAMEYAGLTGKETVLDAYCGIGTIGMVAASKAKRVIGVELNNDAVKDAMANAKANGIRNAEFYHKDAGEFMVQLAEQDEKIDVVFMDPPRTGSDEVFLSSLAALKPERVVYVSCNPETLVRDLEFLVKKGYRVKKGMGCDMFPFCRHVETVALLVKKR